MSDDPQARAQRRAPETEISVDLAESDSTKAVQRRAKPADIAEGVRDQEPGERQKTPAERELFKRMTRFQRNLTKQFDQRLADVEARHQQEMSDLRKQYDSVKIERGGGAEAASEHEKAMKVLEDRLAAANEKGDSQEAARITAEMIRADGAYHAKLAGAKQRTDTATTGATTQTTQPTQVQRRATGPTAAGSRFILANEDWWDDPDYKIEKDAASAIYVALCNEEGYDNNSDETFREVAKRLKAKFKDLPVVRPHAKRGADDEEGEDADLDPDRESRRERAPARHIQDRGDARGQRQNGNRRTLSAEEKATMIKVGLSPDNDRDVVQFLREAMAMEASA
jgi:hypothetical protein